LRKAGNNVFFGKPEITGAREPSLFTGITKKSCLEVAHLDPSQEEKQEK